MSGFATGRNALAECQRSGQKMRYRDLVEDGHIPGLLVHPDWWEPKHPQETPPDVTDPVALYKPAPEISMPTGEGNPLADNTCGTTPNLLYQPSTTLAFALAGGEFFAILEEALTFNIGTCVFIRRNDLSWFMTKVEMDSSSPTFRLELLTAFVGTAAAGNLVYIGTTGSGALI